MSLYHVHFCSNTLKAYPQSPDRPLVEGGVLMQGEELLEVDGVCVLGLWPADLTALLKNAGDSAVLRVVAPATNFDERRTLSAALMYEGKDPETIALSNALRRNLYSWMSPLSTRKGSGRDEAQVVSPIKFKELAAGGTFLEWCGARWMLSSCLCSRNVVGSSA
jgi:hypothetical protein